MWKYVIGLFIFLSPYLVFSGIDCKLIGTILRREGNKFADKQTFVTSLDANQSSLVEQFKRTFSQSGLDVDNLGPNLSDALSGRMNSGIYFVQVPEGDAVVKVISPISSARKELVAATVASKVRENSFIYYVEKNGKGFLVTERFSGVSSSDLFGQSYPDARVKSEVEVFSDQNYVDVHSARYSVLQSLDRDKIVKSAMEQLRKFADNGLVFNGQVEFIITRDNKVQFIDFGADHVEFLDASVSAEEAFKKSSETFMRMWKLMYESNGLYYEL